MAFCLRGRLNFPSFSDRLEIGMGLDCIWISCGEMELKPQFGTEMVLKWWWQ